MVAHSLVVGASADNKVTGKKADVILAAYYAAEAALRLLKGGNENYAVSYKLRASFIDMSAFIFYAKCFLVTHVLLN